MAEVEVIDHHPFPSSVDEAAALYAHNPMFEGEDPSNAPHPDDIRETHMDVIGETDTWRVFRSSLYPHSGQVFVWNHQAGYGLRVQDDEDQFRGLVYAMMQAAEVVA